MTVGPIIWNQIGPDDWVAEAICFEFHIHRTAEVYSTGFQQFETLEEAKAFWQEEYDGQLIRWLYQ